MKTANAPEYLTQQLTYVTEFQPYHLRKVSNFRLNKATNNVMKRSLLYKGLQVFNDLPNEVKNENNISVFKRKCIYSVRSIS